MKRGTFPILGLLSVQPMSGYELKKAIESSLGNFWSESFGQIYPHLSELKKNGLVVASDQVPMTGRRKTTYEITDAGNAALKNWLEEEPVDQVMRNELLLKIFFGTETEQSFITGHLEAALIAAQAKMAQFDLIEQNFEHVPYDEEHKRYWYMTLRFGLLRTRATIEWCEESLKAIRHVAGKEENDRS